jgi:hypothetical protein
MGANLEEQMEDLEDVERTDDFFYYQHLLSTWRHALLFDQRQELFSGFICRWNLATDCIKADELDRCDATVANLTHRQEISAPIGEIEALLIASSAQSCQRS